MVAPPPARRVDTSTLAGVQAASRPAPPPPPRPAPPPPPPAPRPTPKPQENQYLTPEQLAAHPYSIQNRNNVPIPERTPESTARAKAKYDAIQRHLGTQMFELQDPNQQANQQANPFTSWLSSLGQPRVPKPMDIPNPNRLGIFGQPVVEKVDDKIFSLRHTPMPPPPISIMDRAAVLGSGYPMLRNGEEAMRYPELQRDDWGRTVRVPGSYLDEMSPLARPFRSSSPPRLVPVPITPEALENRPRPPWWYSDDSPYPPSQ